MDWNTQDCNVNVYIFLKLVTDSAQYQTKLMEAFLDIHWQGNVKVYTEMQIT